MQTTSFLVAAFAALAAATPMGSAPAEYVPSYTKVLGNPDATPNPVPTAGTIAKLLTSDNRVARFKAIQADIEAKNIDLKFDFNPAANPAITPGEGGQVDLASRANFPLLTGLGISAATIFFQPCGLNTPHIHPGATEFFTVVTDSNMKTGFVLENGLTDEFNTTLTQFQGTAFPQGSIHFQHNLDCEPAVAVAGLNSDDPGTSSIAQNFIVNTNAEVVDATLGFPKQLDASNFAEFKDKIPASLAAGLEECLIRCKLVH